MKRSPKRPPPPPSPTPIPASSDYQSTLVGVRTPATLVRGGRTWRCNMGSTWNDNLDHCLRTTTSRTRFEVRNYSYERIETDPIEKRRSELSSSLPGGTERLPQGVALWGAMSFKHSSWADPVGMRAKTGGVHGQIHDQTFGGSPMLAFRRKSDGQFTITTRGENDTVSHTRYTDALSFDAVYDLVYKLTLHPTAGALEAWIDKVKVVSLSNVSIGASTADCVMAFGAYYAGGITCPVVAEYGNFVYPSTTSLASRTTSTPAWPTT